ncbi:hypothetical protein BM221_010507 [Beauveria bassiana]|uniref:Uncharacterized protein n=1 Tax=Beauveria bassiana TaxID=176275 RepID=A0A2N6N904_BEABA|nr:hypothetical protein BM221_010775 [Beauveria bassiana]PMB63765.1 hypothetical protein BM221_010507 [Beauveria bassiana]
MTHDYRAACINSIITDAIHTAYSGIRCRPRRYTREIHHGFAVFVSGDWGAGLRIIDDVDGLQPAAQVATKPDDVFVSGRGDDELELRLIKMIRVFFCAE